MLHSHEQGLSGENHAASHLQQQGFEILARRWRYGRKEIDLVARRGELVVFVEVKSRSNERFAPIRTSVTAAKKRNLVEAAHGWLAEHDKDTGDNLYRFDVIFVRQTDSEHNVSVEHIEDAFRA
jgi:putative endonuclease